jgi:hypothetical protein
MEQLTALIEYARTHPLETAGGALAIGVLVYLLNRKPKTIREADARLRKLREERSGQYNRFRPPS